MSPFITNVVPSQLQDGETDRRWQTLEDGSHRFAEEWDKRTLRPRSESRRCGSCGPWKVRDTGKRYRPVCNRAPGHPLPHRKYSPSNFDILAEWTEEEATGQAVVRVKTVQPEIQDPRYQPGLFGGDG